MSGNELWRTRVPTPRLGSPNPNCNRCNGDGCIQRELAPRVIHHIACDCEDPDARPDDVAQLAQVVTKTLRTLGIRAFASGVMRYTVSVKHVYSWRSFTYTRTAEYHLRKAPFDSMGPSACVREIQRLEAIQAQDDCGYSDEWSNERSNERKERGCP